MLLSRRSISFLLGVVTAVAVLLPSRALAEGSSELSLGQSCIEAGNYDEALKHLDQSVDAEPTSSDCHYWRAKCLAAMGRTKDAGAEFRTALLLSTDSKMKEDCKSQLKQFSQPIPEGNVNSKFNPKQPFKLTSRKLDWNFPLHVMDATMKAQDAELASLVDGVSPLSGRIGNSPGHNLSAELSDGPAHAAALTASEKEQLRRSDVVIILDHSGSMGTTDCPKANGMGKIDGQAQSRLTWSTEEMEMFSSQICTAMPHGFTFITFDTRPDVYQIRSSNDFDNVLRSLRSGGGTLLTPALEQAFAYHRAHLNEPLLIAIVSDCQIDINSVLETMMAACQHYSLPNGVFFTFLQVGILAERPHTDRPLVPNGRPEPFSILAHMKDYGAPYECSLLVPFSTLRRQGLGRSILESLRNTPMPAVAPLVQTHGGGSAPRPKPAAVKPKK